MAPPLQLKLLTQSYNMPYHSELWVNRIWVTTGIFEFPFLSGEKMDFCYLDKRAMI